MKFERGKVLAGTEKFLFMRFLELGAEVCVRESALKSGLC